jgi:hypothetical protein
MKSILQVITALIPRYDIETNKFEHKQLPSSSGEIAKTGGKRKTSG